MIGKQMGTMLIRMADIHSRNQCNQLSTLVSWHAVVQNSIH